MKFDAVSGLEGAGWPVLLLDGSGVVRHANPAAIKLFGNAVEGQHAQFSSLWAANQARTSEQFLAEQGRTSTGLVPGSFRVKEGTTAHFLVALNVLPQEGHGLLLQFFSETGPGGEGKGDTATFAHRQKLDCALQLARTVALDFNNALTSILGHTSLLLSKMEPKHPWRSALLEVEKSAAKAAEIANDLGTFSRQEKESRTQVARNLNSLVQRTVEICSQSTPPGLVVWDLRLERKLFAARFDEAKLQQALIKVFENAIQAISEPGHVTVQTSNLEVTELFHDRNTRLSPGAYVRVEVSDTGCGIPADALPRIFEPFFTTKKGTKHRGLGLAWVYGILTNHGGGVAISSHPGSGTSVRMYLPAEKRIVRDSPVPSGDLNGTQTVLMVDDEDLLLTMGQTILSSYGYRVLTANSGQKALDLLENESEPVDLLITDLVMPAMSGRELIEHVRKVSPRTRILRTSGYVSTGKQDEESLYLQKPFTSQDLLLRVKLALATE